MSRTVPCRISYESDLLVLEESVYNKAPIIHNHTIVCSLSMMSCVLKAGDGTTS
jgi:hypothetical protein